MFLDEAEWLTYCKRKPVRYIRTFKAAVCQVCGQPGSPENPLQKAHIIGFDVGVIDLGMTPDFLDSEKNIVAPLPVIFVSGCAGQPISKFVVL